MHSGAVRNPIERAHFLREIENEKAFSVLAGRTRCKLKGTADACPGAGPPVRSARAGAGSIAGWTDTSPRHHARIHVRHAFERRRRESGAVRADVARHRTRRRDARERRRARGRAVSARRGGRGEERAEPRVRSSRVWGPVRRSTLPDVPAAAGVRRPLRRGHIDRSAARPSLRPVQTDRPGGLRQARFRGELHGGVESDRVGGAARGEVPGGTAGRLHRDRGGGDREGRRRGGRSEDE